MKTVIQTRAYAQRNKLITALDGELECIANRWATDNDETFDACKRRLFNLALIGRWSLKHVEQSDVEEQ